MNRHDVILDYDDLTGEEQTILCLICKGVKDSLQADGKVSLSKHLRLHFAELIEKRIPEIPSGTDIHLQVALPEDMHFSEKLIELHGYHDLTKFSGTWKKDQR